jgi:hypothetical protein
MRKQQLKELLMAAYDDGFRQGCSLATDAHKPSALPSRSTFDVFIGLDKTINRHAEKHAESVLKQVKAGCWFCRLRASEKRARLTTN